ncbi:MAG: protein kinase [Planctomycetaceae bacterium]
MSKSQNQTCSNRVHLERYLNEELSEPEETEVQQHISSCPDCQQAMEKLAGDKSIWDGLRDHVTWISDDDEGNDQDERITRLIGYLAPTDDPRMIGRLGTYEVCGIIGQGSTGIVLKALEPALNRFVAIKVMSPLFSSNGAARKRFEREGRAVAAVAHDHVVPIYAVSEFRNLPYIVMKYIPGVSLLQRMQNDGPLDTCEVTRIGLQVSKALEAAHAQGIVHRDVNPANVLLENTVDRAMVTDFGLARVADDASMTRSGTIAGTPQYMSPEQAKGERVDPRSDLFSLGSLMYAACTARPPFRAETVFGVIHRVCNEEPRAIREINPKIDEWLVSFIDKLMEKQAEDRFQSAKEVTTILSTELAYAQSPTTAPKPERDWTDQATVASPLRWKLAIGLAVAAMAVVAAFFLPKQFADGNNFVAGLFAPFEQSTASDPDDKKKTGTAAQPEAPPERILEIPCMTAGLPPGGITWSRNKDEWNKNAVIEFDQKVQKELFAGKNKGGKVIVDADIADVVVRHTEADVVTMTVMRRVLADTQKQADQFLKTYHSLFTDQDEKHLHLQARFQRRQPEPGADETGIVMKHGKVIANNGRLTTKGIAAQTKLRKVLITISLPRDSDIEVRTAKGDISFGEIDTNVTAEANRGDINVGPTHGDLNLITVKGDINASQGCDGSVVVQTETGTVAIANVKGKLIAESHQGRLNFAGIDGPVKVRTSGGKAVARDCKGEVDMMTTHGNLVLTGFQESGYIRASGGNIFLDETTGDVYAHASGGNIVVNEIAGKTRAHAEHGNVMFNCSKAPTHDADFSANAGNVRLNISETVAANIETIGNFDAGTTPGEVSVTPGTDGGPARAVTKLNNGGKVLTVSSSTGNIALNVLKPEELKKSLGGSGLGGSGGSAKAKAASAAALAKTTGSPRPGAQISVKLDANESNIDGYTLYLPESHDKHDGKFAVLVYLSGGFSVGGDIRCINDWGLTRLVRDEHDLSIERNKLLLDSFIVVAPHIKGGDYHDHPKVVQSILDTVMTKYKGDANRIYLTGLSRGGHGTWGLASQMPDTFAAISPIASSPENITDYAAVSKPAIWIAQNTGDRFPHSEILKASTKLEQVGEFEFFHIKKPNASGTNYLDHRYVFSSPRADGHDAWTDMYESVEFYRWLLKQRKTVDEVAAK